MHISLSVCMSPSLSACLFVHVFVCLYMFSLSVRPLSVREFFVCLPSYYVCMYVYLKQKNHL